MRRINQKFVDKTIQTLLLACMDIGITYAFIEQVKCINYSNAARSIPILAMLLCFVPFVICQHLKNVPKYIEEKFTYLLVLSSVCFVAFVCFNDFLKEGFGNSINKIFSLTSAILFTMIAILFLIKLITTKKIASTSGISNKAEL